jgi:hypothetical protein
VRALLALISQTLRNDTEREVRLTAKPRVNLKATLKKEVNGQPATANV